MTGYLLEMFGVSLALTLVIELAAGCFFGMRSRKTVLLILLVNLLTNPAAVLLCWLGVPQIPVELGVVLTEALIYLWFSGDERWFIAHPLLFSLAANLISWSAGILVQSLGG